MVIIATVGDVYFGTTNGVYLAKMGSWKVDIKITGINDAVVETETENVNDNYNAVIIGTINGDAYYLSGDNTVIKYNNEFNLSYKEKVNKVNSQITELTNKLSDANKKVYDFEQNEIKWEEEKDKLKLTKQNLEEQVNNEKNTNNKLNQDLKTKQNENNQLKTEQEQLKSKNNKLIQENEDKLTNLNSEITDWNNRFKK